jgi:outer membrane protein TolC
MAGVGDQGMIRARMVFAIALGLWAGADAVRAQAPAVEVLTQPAGIPAPPSSLLGGPFPFGPTAVPAGDTPYPISLPVVLELANARPLDVAIAAKQVEAAVYQYDRAKLLWVPNLVVGGDYYRHEGGQQNFAGDIPRSSRGSVAVGLGPNLVFSFADAVYAPLAARQDLLARRANRQAVANDLVLFAAEAYFAVQQARGDLAGLEQAAAQADDLARKTATLAEGLALPLEATRAKVELARQRQAVAAARERWRVASAELTRVLRLAPGVTVEPVEPPSLPVTLIRASATLDELIPIALTNRPELAGQQAVVQAALARLKQEKIRPLVPSLALRSVSTNPSGSIGFGGFGGGPNDRVGNFGTRLDLDVQLLWEFSNLGFGNKAKVGEKRAEYEAATLELFRAQDLVAAEVVAEYARARGAAERLAAAEPALKDAIDVSTTSLAALTQTRRVGDVVVLVVRPQEVVAAVQARAQATADFFAAVADYNRAQFRLYRALGHPGNCLADAVPAPPAPPAAEK